MADDDLGLQVQELTRWLARDGKQRRSWGFWLLAVCALLPVAGLVLYTVLPNQQFREVFAVVSMGGYGLLIALGLHLRSDGGRKIDAANSMNEVLDWRARAPDDDDD